MPKGFAEEGGGTEELEAKGWMEKPLDYGVGVSGVWLQIFGNTSEMWNLAFSFFSEKYVKINVPHSIGKTEMDLCGF